MRAMTKQIRAFACTLRFPRCAWLPLALLVASACKPRDLVCENGPYFQVLQPDAGAGAAPFNIERLGAEVKHSSLEVVLDALILKTDNRVHAEWVSAGHVH